MPGGQLNARFHFQPPDNAQLPNSPAFRESSHEWDRYALGNDRYGLIAAEIGKKPWKGQPVSILVNVIVFCSSCVREFGSSWVEWLSIDKVVLQVGMPVHLAPVQDNSVAQYSYLPY